MTILFTKYQGTGNDFVIIDDRENKFPSQNTKLVNQLCDRKFGVGSDGLMLLQKSTDHDFKMVYYNSDGKEGTMCGNGGRCIVAFAFHLGIIDSETSFEAIDGVHKAVINYKEVVNLKMNDVNKIEQNGDDLYLNTGSPHYVVQVDAVNKLNVVEQGRNIRYNNRFKPEGTNVNFWEATNNSSIFVRTYERGVEDETLSCGTGVIATAISAAFLKVTDKNTVNIQTLGGNLQVNFNKVSDQLFTDVWLKGPANFVFKGEIEI